MSLTLFQESAKPNDRGAFEGECDKCGSKVLLIKSAKNAQLVLDLRPGPYIIAEDDDGLLKGFWKPGNGGYAFHYDGGCSGDAETFKAPTKFELLAATVAASRP